MAEAQSRQHVNYYWTEYEKQYIAENFETMTDAEIGEHLGCNAACVYHYRRGQKLKKRKMWTPEEEERLSELWGHKTFKAICMELGRSQDSIHKKVSQLGLGPYLENGTFISLPEFMRVYKGNSLKTNQALGWIRSRGLPVHYKRLGKRRVSVIYIDEFWKWAEQNISHLDFSKLEPLCFGLEPDWVDKKRRQDIRNRLDTRKNDRWTPEEDQRLTYMVQSQKYTYAEVSQSLRRTSGAVKGRCKALGLNMFPVKSHSKRWTDSDYELLLNGIKMGFSYSAIAKSMDRSEEAVKGKVFTTYLTEDMDKVRHLIGSGKWGDGAPEINVRQGICISKYKTTVKKDLRRLDELLRVRIDELSQ